MKTELIETLAEQAYFETEYDDTQNLPELMARLVELTVKECMESLWTEECHTSDLAVEEYNRNCKKIKQHFGVEE